MKNSPLQNNKAKDTGLAIVLLLLIILYFTKIWNLLLPAIVVLIVSILCPQVFDGISRIWFRAVEALSTLASRLILSILFYMLVVPIGLIRKLTGADPMQLRSWKNGRETVFRIRNTTYSAKDMDKPF